jgi:hypothetical protein
VWLDWLGLNPQQASAILGVRHDTVRRWVSGREPVPVRVGDELEQVDTRTAAAVDALVTALGDMPDPAVVIYRSDEDAWTARPDLHPYPASWWRMIVARATVEVPGVEIAYADNTRR